LTTLQPQSTPSSSIERTDRRLETKTKDTDNNLVKRQTSTTTTEFVVTKQHRRCIEFCDAMRRDRYIGLCHGVPGVGKTLSARHYNSWDTVGSIVHQFRFYETVAPESELVARTVFYTPKVHNTPGIVDNEVHDLHTRLSWAVETTLHPDRGSEQLIESGGPWKSTNSPPSQAKSSTPPANPWSSESCDANYRRFTPHTIEDHNLGVQGAVSGAPPRFPRTDTETAGSAT
jgi:hypothetical protein